MLNILVLNWHYRQLLPLDVDDLTKEWSLKEILLVSRFVASDQEKAADAEPKAKPSVRAGKPAARPLLQLPIAKPRRRASDEANDKVPYGFRARPYTNTQILKRQESPA